LNYPKIKTGVSKIPDGVLTAFLSSLTRGVLITGIASFYALSKEMTFLIKVKSVDKIKTTERIFTRISKVPMLFYNIIRISVKGNTILKIIFTDSQK